MKMFIAGEWVGAAKSMPVYNPYDQSVIDEAPIAGSDDVEKAIQSAQRGAAIMEDMPYWKRAEIIAKAAALISERKEAISRVLSLENGKTMPDARGELDRVIMTLSASAETAKAIHGETLPLSAYSVPGIENKFGFTMRVPCGVVLAISPFNSPLNLASHKLGPALACGNSVIFKAASDTPLSSAMLVEAFLDAGLPPEAIQYVSGPGGALGEMLCPDKRIRKISFTGSHAVGNAICKLAGMKRVTMELGGNGPVIVMPDADPDKVANLLMLSGYAYAGQFCVSTQRVFIHQDLYEPIIRKVADKCGEFVLGNPQDEKTTMVPLIRESDARRVEEIIQEAGKNGARILCGGERKGNFVTPAVVADVKADMRIFREELFGPGIAFTPFTSLEDAINGANDTDYGLAAGLFTNDLENAMQIVRRVKSGVIHVNNASRWRIDHMPYGGMKDSGIGREGPRSAISEYTEVRTVVMHMNTRSPM